MAAKVALICDLVPSSVTLAVPLPVIVALPPLTVSVPWAADSTTCMPLASSSTSAMLIVPPSARPVSSLTLCPPGTALTGGSLTALTAIEAVSVAVLKAVEPPLVLVSAVPPLLPLVWSQARKVSPVETLPFQLLLGTNRTRVSALAAKSVSVRDKHC